MLVRGLMGYWKFRRDKRAEKSKAVFYVSKNGNLFDESFFAVAVNVSECGVCILTDRPVEKGEVFLLESGLWTKARQAKAVWTNCIGNALYEAGFALC
jgi:hypothetical protein